MQTQARRGELRLRRAKIHEKIRKVVKFSPVMQATNLRFQELLRRYQETFVNYDLS